MDTHFIKTQGKELLILKVSGNLILDGYDGEDLQVQSNPRDLKIQVDDDALRVTTYGNCTMSVPKKMTVRVEKVGGNAVIRNIGCDDFYVQRIGGNLSVLDVNALTVSRVGGGCQVKNVGGALNLERISGELYVFNVNGPVEAASIRADATLMMMKQQTNVAASGNVILHFSGEVLEPISIRSKADITLFLPQNPNADLNATFSGWDIVLTMAGRTENHGGGSFTGQLGTGGPEIKLNASGDIVISDEHFNTPVVPDLDMADGEGTKDGEFRFSLDFNSFAIDTDSMDAYGRRIEKAMQKVEQKLQKAESRMGETNRRVAEQQEEIARRIEERAMNRAMHAEKLAEIRVQKRVHAEAREAFEQVREELRNLDLPIDLPALDFLKEIEIPPVPPMPNWQEPPTAPKPPVARESAHEERMLILDMLKDGTISVDEAETLLSAIKG